MYKCVIFLSLLAVALAGPQTCHQSKVQWVGCSTNYPDICDNKGESPICQIYPGLNSIGLPAIQGICTSTTFECPAGTECFGYECKVPHGGSCTSTSQCGASRSCIGNTCKCPAVLNYGQTQCFWLNDAAGPIINPAYTYCGATNRTCQQTVTNPSSPNYSIGTCVSPLNGKCDTDNDCSAGKCVDCKCEAENDGKRCRHRTAIVRAMIAFEECIAPFTVVPSGSMLELMCDIAASNCVHHFNAIDTYNSGYVANGVMEAIANHPNIFYTEKVCSYRGFLSNICDTNLHFI